MQPQIDMNMVNKAVTLVTRQKKTRKPKSDTFFSGLNELIEDRVQDAIERMMPTTHEYTCADNTSLPTLKERQHYLFPLVQILVKTKGINTYLWGEKGCGKSSIAINAAKSLGIDPVIIACDRDVTRGYFLGYMSAEGKYIPGMVYNAFKNGGVVILEEFDSLSPGVRLCLNNLIANSHFTFPNVETCEKHPNFRVIATGNTLSIGATQQYVARQAQDSASIDRFVYLEIPLDESLEAEIFGSKCADLLIMPSLDLDSGGIPNNDEWLKLIRDYRTALKQSSIPETLSSRAVIMGNLLAQAGIGKNHLVKMLVTKCLTQDQVNKVNSILGVN